MSAQQTRSPRQCPSTQTVVGRLLRRLGLCPLSQPKCRAFQLQLFLASVYGPAFLAYAGKALGRSMLTWTWRLVCVLKGRLVSSVSLQFICLVFCYVSPHQLQFVNPSQWYPVCVLFPQCVILLVRASPEGLPPSFCGCHIYFSRCVTCSYKALLE